MIKAKVNIETAKGTYGPGEIIREKLSVADIDFLKRRGFISVGEDENMQFSEVDTFECHQEGVIEGLNLDFDGLAECDGNECKDEDALKKMNKEELVTYGAEIGLKLDISGLKTDLINDILNYQEERMAVE